MARAVVLVRHNRFPTTVLCRPGLVRSSVTAPVAQKSADVASYPVGVWFQVAWLNRFPLIPTALAYPLRVVCPMGIRKASLSGKAAGHRRRVANPRLVRGASQQLPGAPMHRGVVPRVRREAVVVPNQGVGVVTTGSLKVPQPMSRVWVF